MATKYNQEEKIQISDRHCATVYKQIPGADIEPGWYVVTHGHFWAPEPHKWRGPYPTKRAAVKAAKEW